MKNFVVYEVVSTMIVDHTGKVNRLKTYKSERAAKTARTKALKVNGGVLLGVMEYYEFVNTVELSVERINFMTNTTVLHDQKHTGRCDIQIVAIQIHTFSYIQISYIQKFNIQI